MLNMLLLAVAGMLSICVKAMPQNDSLAAWNLNVVRNTNDPLKYDAERPSTNSPYTASPSNWRQQSCYTLMLDKFSDGDPSNNDFFKTQHEFDTRETHFRAGGDISGLRKQVPYLNGMGVTCLYLAGTPFINMPWGSDGYSPLDFSLMDPHYGTIQEWRDTIDYLHANGIYIILDFTVGTMADLISFKGFETTSAPLVNVTLVEYELEWKKSSAIESYAPWGLSEYADFKYSNELNETCKLPVFWNSNGTIMEQANVVSHVGCLTSEFDGYGDMEALGNHPDWERQLGKFMSVQDRLREWDPEVNAKLQVFPCLAIKALDIDGIRIDKSIQVTADGLASWSHGTRTCAGLYNKKNFLIAGEVVNGNTFGSLYYGRGRSNGFDLAEPVDALTPSNKSTDYIRPYGMAPLDSVAFHYSVYRSLIPFLGLDGNPFPEFDATGLSFATIWNEMLVSNDFINSVDGSFDPRHLYGASNFDVFRWASLVQGKERQMLATIITAMVMPGIPLYYYGEEQGMYVFDNDADDFLYGRQPMFSNTAWQKQGCYDLSAQDIVDFPLEKALTGCTDDWNSLDHFDVTANTRRVWKRINQLRALYPVLVDGFSLVESGTWTEKQAPTTRGVIREYGLWSVIRDWLPNRGYNQAVWFLYSNKNTSMTYTFDCNGADAIIAPYASGTIMRNLFYPYQTVTLGSQNGSGCLPTIDMTAYGFVAFVPATNWTTPLASVTTFSPGHDSRQLSNNTNTLNIAFEFDATMDCNSINSALTLNASTKGSVTPSINLSTVSCSAVTRNTDTEINAASVGTFRWSARIDNAVDGIYQLSLNKPSTSTGNMTTGSNDIFLIRKGLSTNPMVYPSTADYNNGVLYCPTTTYCQIKNTLAPGADKFRYTFDYGTTWSNWLGYTEQIDVPANYSLTRPNWNGIHVMVQYWSTYANTAQTVLHGDAFYAGNQRRKPQLLARGKFNNWGLDKGLTTNLENDGNSDGWTMALMTQWPASIQLNVFGYDDYYLSDPRGDGLARRLPPNSLSPNFFNMTTPPYPHLGWTFHINDATDRWYVTPRGHVRTSVIIFVLFAIIPIIGAFLSIMFFTNAFYAIKVNEYGSDPKGLRWYRRWSRKAKETMTRASTPTPESRPVTPGPATPFSMPNTPFTSMPNTPMGSPPQSPTLGHRRTTSSGSPFWPQSRSTSSNALNTMAEGSEHSSDETMVHSLPAVAPRRKILIATLEYEILGWNIKVRIGGLGVMTSMMARSMSDVDLIWVIPKVGGVVYPAATRRTPITVTIFDKPSLVEIDEYVIGNITYILLESPVFRAQNQKEPYPKRMDDMSSAIYYSTWNQVIATVVKRYPIDIFHINDYHGAIAPLYLLPDIIPVVVSLHNAEFQGSWPLRTQEEITEVCGAFNLSEEISSKYIRFGNTFNLLHAAANFVSFHQKSIGVAGVSEKYGKRSWARYPALWTLKTIEALPNPDPSDMAALDLEMGKSPMVPDAEAEKLRPLNKLKAQQWAKLNEDPKAELFVFVGRWSKQKGIDLIADAMVSLLNDHKQIQLICVGPLVDIYGRFAATKLARLMELHPGRVCSIPQFTLIPKEINSGADFALIPSRDEPFGLVAVEFGRQGALGIGSRLGGLGLMPGWWYPVESDTTAHLLSQFVKTIKLAMKSTQQERAVLRARSAVQRFPVLVWRQKIDSFHARAITASKEQVYGKSTTSLIPSAMSSVYDLTSSWKHRSNPKLLSPSQSTLDLFNRVPSPPTSPRASVVKFEQQEFSPPIPGYVSFADALPEFTHSDSFQSADDIMKEKAGSPLQESEEVFNDDDGQIEEHFVNSLQRLSASNSMSALCIHKIIEQGEKAHFKERHRLKLSSPTIPLETEITQAIKERPTRVERFMQKRIGEWPIYSIFISFGQILASTALQLTLLSGTNSQTALDIYSIGGIFLGATILWWILFRIAPSVYVLTVPWIIFSIVFCLVGVSAIIPTLAVAHKIMQGAILLYAFASAAGVFFFSLNFGEEAGSATSQWVIRSLIIQSIQQVWVALLWFWGHTYDGTDPALYKAPIWLAGVAFPIMALTAFCGLMLFFGLPKYYWQTPAQVPNLWKTLFRRKLVLWFVAAEILKDYWLSTQYGRSWQFIWDFATVPFWAPIIMTIISFLIILPTILYGLYKISKTHTWALPIFAVGLGTPRWCQTFWATSGVGSFLPWAGAGGPYASIILWLWLGILDGVQGVGIGIMLLQTLSRIHVAAALFMLQLVGTTSVLIAHASAPHKLSPFSVFPNVGMWGSEGGIANSVSEIPFFWLALVCQLVALVGYFLFYRKDQLSKP